MTATASSSTPLAADVLGRLRALGLTRIRRCTLTRNQSVVASFRGDALRLQRAFADAPDDVLRAIVVFVEGRGAARAAARRHLLAWPIPRDPARVPRRERPHPDDAALTARLRQLHDALNRRWFGGALGSIDLRVSRRMRRKLGHYAPRTASRGATIAISWRHLRRDSWERVADTMLHELVHQWQDETGRTLGHGPAFWRKAAEVGLRGRD